MKMIAIFRHTISRSKVQILAWGLGMALLGAYMVMFYDNLMGMQDTIQQMIENYPKELVAFVGGAEGLFSEGGYINSYIFSYLPLILGVFAILAGSGLLAADEESGVLDLLISHPISRTRFFLGRLLGFSFALAAIMFIMWVGFVAPMGSSGLNVSALDMAFPFLSLFALLFLFATLGLLFSLLLPSRSSAAMASGLILVVSFFMSLMSRLDENMEMINKFSPYGYYQGGEAINGMNWGWFLGLIGVSLLISIICWWLFQQRDIRITGERSWLSFMRFHRR
jgi:ABC-2 type transport system permease protein